VAQGACGSFGPGEAPGRGNTSQVVSPSLRHDVLEARDPEVTTPRDGDGGAATRRDLRGPGANACGGGVMAGQTVAPGWYPDPSGIQGRLRWWDGQQWGEEVQEPVPAGTATQPAAEVTGPDMAAAADVEPAAPAEPGPSKLRMLGTIAIATVAAAAGVALVIFFMGS